MNIISKIASQSRFPRIFRYYIYKEIVKNNLLYSITGSFIGIVLIGILSNLFFDINDAYFLIGSFGASAVLVYGLPRSPLSKPKNLFGGHLISAFVGVTTCFVFHNYPPLAAGIAVSLSIGLMQITRTVHPPGGATALIAVIGSEKIKALGYYYLISPVLAGVLTLYLIAIIVKPLKRYSR